MRHNMDKCKANFITRGHSLPCQLPAGHTDNHLHIDYGQYELGRYEISWVDKPQTPALSPLERAWSCRLVGKVMPWRPGHYTASEAKELLNQYKAEFTAGWEACQKRAEADNAD